MTGFKKATREKVKLKLAIIGPTGSGKTYSALRLAKGLNGKIALIDAENRSASLYSDKFDFDVLDLAPPFTTEKYIAAINDAEKAGYEIIIIDSLSHAWAGEGGLLEQKALLDSRPGSNHWSNWGPIDKKDQQLKNAFLHSSCHIIATMRSKMEYAQVDDGGKKKIQKLGLAPVQRDGLTYDFTIVFDVAMDNQCEVSKDRTGLFAGRIFKITEENGEEINQWLATGAVPTMAPTPPPPAAPPVQKFKTQETKPQVAPQSKVPPKSLPNRAPGASNPPPTQTIEPVVMDDWGDHLVKKTPNKYVGSKLRDIPIHSVVETLLNWEKSGTVPYPAQPDVHAMKEYIAQRNAEEEAGPPQSISDVTAEPPFDDSNVYEGGDVRDPVSGRMY